MNGSDKHLRILAFEPFDAGSHRAVRESISRHSRHQWTWITRPGRYWKWRMRFAAIEMLDDAQRQGAVDLPHDVVFVTSLMSAADMRSLLPARLRNQPIMLSMHENQAAYPAGHETELSAKRDLQFPLTNLASILAADAVLWNSAWNRDSFLDGIERILKHGADLNVPSDLRDRVLSKSSVIWPPVEWPDDEGGKAAAGRAVDDASTGKVLHNVPLARAGSDARVGGGDKRDAGAGERDWGLQHDKSGRTEATCRTEPLGRPIRIVWPHRWEHDKGPDELLSIARTYSESLNLRWTILGERFRRVPEKLPSFEREFADRIDHIGYVSDQAAYRQHLARCDWVLSTARHEFFGIAVVEALLAGCLPWLPRRLSYPELLPEESQGISPINPPDDPEAIRRRIRSHLQPALASNAVARLDEAVESLAASYAPDTPQAGVRSPDDGASTVQAPQT